MFIKRLSAIIICLELGTLLFSSKALSSTKSLPDTLSKYPEITSTTAVYVTGTNPTLTSGNTFTEALYDIWIKQHTSENIGDVVTQLNNVKLDNGFMNLYPYSLVLLNEYNENYSKQLLQYAVLLSPSMSEPYFKLSYLMLTGRDRHYVLAGIYMLRAAETFFNDPYNMLRFVSNRFINITLAALIVFFIFSFLLIIRYSMQIYAYIKGKLPESVPVYATILFSVIITMIPFLFGAGFLWLLVLWLALTLAFQKPSERFMSMGFIVFFTLLTYIALVVVATILKPAEEPFTGIMSVHYGSLSTKDVDGLNTYADSHKDDLYSNLYMGVYYKRIGMYNTAYNYFKRLLDNGYGNSSMVISNIGNLEYALGDVASAEDNYRKAVSINHNFFAAHYNLGQLYLIKANIEGTNELDIARGIAPGLFAYYASIYQKSNINRIFADALPEPRELAYNMFKETLHNETAVGLADVMISRLIAWPSAKHLPYMGLWLLLLFMVIITLSRYARTRLRCKSCGKVYSSFNRNDEYKEAVCIDCLRFNVRNDIKDNKKKLEITQRVRRWKKSLRIMNIVTSALIPGSGYIISGQTVKGMAVLSLFSYLMVEYISSFGLITSVLPLSNPYIGMLKVLVLIIIAGLYAGNIILAVKTEAKWY